VFKIFGPYGLDELLTKLYPAGSQKQRKAVRDVDVYIVSVHAFETMFHGACALCMCVCVCVCVCACVC
jgi:hypothetical protein